MNTELILIDLFSGIGGFAKGFEQAGFTFDKHYFSEIDKNAIANYKYNFKNAEYAGDIKFISGRAIRERHSNARIFITFGFPCQDLSVAGKGAGFYGERSVLYYEAIRLIKEIGPEVFIFENVKGLLSHNQSETFTTVLRTIADIGLYECEWQLLNTAWVLPQNRERIYFIGHLAGKSKCRVFPFRETDFRINEGQSNAAIVRTITAGGHSGGHHSGMTLICDSGNGRKLEEREILAPLRSNTGAGYGNYVLQKGRGFNKGGEHDICPTISSNSFQQNNFVKRQPLKFLNRNQKNYEGDYAYTIDSANTGGVNINGDIRRLTEIECEKLQGFPPDWTKYGIFEKQVWINKKEKTFKIIEGVQEISRTQRYKMIGNAVTVKIVELIAKRLL